jgi:hypothetical protein
MRAKKVASRFQRRFQSASSLITRPLRDREPWGFSALTTRERHDEIGAPIRHFLIPDWAGGAAVLLPIRRVLMAHDVRAHHGPVLGQGVSAAAPCTMSVNRCSRCRSSSVLNKNSASSKSLPPQTRNFMMA